MPQGEERHDLKCSDGLLAKKNAALLDFAASVFARSRHSGSPERATTTALAHRESAGIGACAAQLETGHGGPRAPNAWQLCVLGHAERKGHAWCRWWRLQCRRGERRRGRGRGASSECVPSLLSGPVRVDRAARGWHGHCAALFACARQPPVVACGQAGKPVGTTCATSSKGQAQDRDVARCQICAAAAGAHSAGVPTTAFFQPGAAPTSAQAVAATAPVGAAALAVAARTPLALFVSVSAAVKHASPAAANVCDQHVALRIAPRKPRDHDRVPRPLLPRVRLPGQPWQPAPAAWAQVLQHNEHDATSASKGAVRPRNGRGDDRVRRNAHRQRHDAEAGGHALDQPCHRGRQAVRTARVPVPLGAAALAPASTAATVAAHTTAAAVAAASAARDGRTHDSGRGCARGSAHQATATTPSAE